jgi:ankyrin repeat protein
MSIVFDKLQQYWWSLTDDNCIDIPLTTVNQLNMLGESPIHIAAWRGSAEDVEWLIKNGANVNALGDLGMTPLHYAYMARKPETIKVLLEAGANPSLRCERGLLPAETQTAE